MKKYKAIVIVKAVWRSVSDIKSEGSKLNPSGIEAVINGL
jgi:hypothetical protein